MPDRETRTILLVDSSASILFYLALLLKRLEYKVVTARSAEDALRMMHEALPSIIMTELSLPKMSGIQFLKHIKDTARFSAIPVVILTSENDPGMKDTCMRIGSAGYVAKPVEPDVLYRTLQTASESVPRLNIRLHASLKVIVGDGSALGGTRRTEFATAISEGGLYIRTLFPQPRNALTPLRLFINDREISAKAIVLYSYALGEGPFEEPGMGMKFVELSDADRALIRAFIKEQLTGDITPQDSGTAL
jgi:two-component system, chemotaxis family, chemotaxis protein CheY